MKTLMRTLAVFLVLIMSVSVLSLVVGQNQSEPNPQPAADSDNDGLTDDFETNESQTNPNQSDSDEDGLPDGWEQNNGLDPNDKSDVKGDKDNDELANGVEFEINTDPSNPDSDGDGHWDGKEAVPLHPTMKVRAAQETKYAIVDLGPSRSPVGLNDNGEVALSYGSNCWIWSKGAAKSFLATGGIFAGPLQDGRVYFYDYIPQPSPDTVHSVPLKAAWSSSEKVNSSVVGKFRSTYSNNSGQRDAGEISAALLFALNVGGVFSGTEANQLMKRFDATLSELAKISAEREIKYGATQTWSGQQTDRINDAKMTVVRSNKSLYGHAGSFVADLRADFWGCTDKIGGSTSFGLTKEFALVKFERSQYYTEVLIDKNEGEAIYELFVNTNGVVVYNAVRGGMLGIRKTDPLGKDSGTAIPQCNKVLDINSLKTGEAPYLLGTYGNGGAGLWCLNGGDWQSIPISGAVPLAGNLIGRLLSNHVEIPMGKFLWRNSRLRPISDICDDPEKWTNFNMTLVSPVRNLLAGTAVPTIDESGEAILPGSQQRHAVMLVPAELVTDANRDGVIDKKDYGTITEENPWRFWINDDDDAGFEEGDDIPGKTNKVADGLPFPDHEYPSGPDGVRDLVDYFPLYLEIAALLRIMPPDACDYYLSQSDEALIFIYTDLERKGEKGSKLDAYLRNPETAAKVVRNKAQIIKSEGTKLDKVFLEKIMRGDKGVLLLEGRKKTIKPLALDVRKDGKTLATISFEMSIDGVEAMFRMQNLSNIVNQLPPYVAPEQVNVEVEPRMAEPPNYPDSIQSKKWFIFVHGCCTGQSQARGWHSEVFKRMFWSGSNAKFLGVTWRGDESRGGKSGALDATLNYHQNVIYAFATGRFLAPMINQLEGEKIIAAHSLGNIVVSTAINDGWDGMSATGDEMNVKAYYMTDAAVPMSSYSDKITTEVENRELPRDAMRHPDWKKKEYRLTASEWYQRFISTDKRSELTWNGRFSDVFSRTRTINYHSTGEEVLENGNGELPEKALWQKLSFQTSPGLTGGVKVWVGQELSKGQALVSLTTPFEIYFDVHGGWGFSGAYSTRPRRNPKKIEDSELREKPFFLNFRPPLDKLHAMQGDIIANVEASDYFVKSTLLAEAIPSLSFAVGSNQLEFPSPSDEVNVNMNADALNKAGGFVDRSKWPNRKDLHKNLQMRWLHSDLKVMAYIYTHRLFDDWVKRESPNTDSSVQP